MLLDEGFTLHFWKRLCHEQYFKSTSLLITLITFPQVATATKISDGLSYCKELTANNYLMHYLSRGRWSLDNISQGFSRITMGITSIVGSDQEGGGLETTSFPDLSGYPPTGELDQERIFLCWGHPFSDSVGWAQSLTHCQQEKVSAEWRDGSPPKANSSGPHLCSATESVFGGHFLDLGSSSRKLYVKQRRPCHRKFLCRRSVLRFHDVSVAACGRSLRARVVPGV